MKTRRLFSLATTGALLYSLPICAQDNTPAPVVTETPKPKKEDPTEPIPRLELKWKTGGGWQSTHEDYVKRAARGKVNLLFFGDSLTHWWDWKDFKARYEKWGGVNFGIGGDKTQNLLWRVQNGELEGIQPKVAVVLIGTNNLGDDAPDPIAAGIAKIVSAIREKSPATKVLLLGLFPRGWDANQVKWYNAKIQKINAALAKLDDGKSIRYADFSPQLLETDGTLSRKIFKDGLHLSPEGYARWANAMQPILEEMLGLPPSQSNPVAAPLAPASTGVANNAAQP